MEATDIWVRILIIGILLLILYQCFSAIRLLAGIVLERVRSFKRGDAPISYDNKVLLAFLISLVIIGVSAQRTLIGSQVLFRVYFGGAACGWLWARWRDGSNSTGLFHGVTLGFFGLGPVCVALLLSLNLVPRSITHEDHPLYGMDQWCTDGFGLRTRGCVPIMIFKDAAFADWRRARTRHDRPAKGTTDVRFTIGEGLFGYRVVYWRDDIAKDPI